MLGPGLRDFDGPVAPVDGLLPHAVDLVAEDERITRPRIDGQRVEHRRALDLLDGVSLPASSTLFVDSMLARTPALEADRDAAFRRTVERLDTLGKMDFTVPASLKATLRGYQVDGYQWLGSLEHLGLGGILADDMGLGKTLQMIAHILVRVEAGDTKPTLVVCPASLVYNWTAELERFAPSLDVCAIVGAKAQRRVQIAGVAEHNVVVTSYDLMRRDIDD